MPQRSGTGRPFDFISRSLLVSHTLLISVLSGFVMIHITGYRSGANSCASLGCAAK